jgi:hypothetical protein
MKSFYLLRSKMFKVGLGASVFVAKTLAYMDFRFTFNEAVRL